VAATGEGFTGEVTEIAPSPEPESGMYPVRILIDNPDTELRPGMTAEVKITRERAEDVLIIPRQALSARGDEYHVFVVEEGMARRRQVRVGMQDEDYAEVRSGLNEGDVVVYYGMQYLEDGTSVVIAGEKE